MKPAVCEYRSLHDKHAVPWCYKCGKQCKDITPDKCPKTEDADINECLKNTEMEVEK